MSTTVRAQYNSPGMGLLRGRSLKSEGSASGVGVSQAESSGITYENICENGRFKRWYSFETDFADDLVYSHSICVSSFHETLSASILSRARPSPDLGS